MARWTRCVAFLLSPLAAAVPAAGFFVSFIGVASAQSAGPKIIYLGWDSPIPSTFLSEFAAREASGVPLDGTVINFTAQAQGLRRPFSNGFAGSPADQQMPGPLTASSLQAGIDDMQAASPQVMTDNFLRFLCQPGNVDFFDDVGWTYILETSRLASYAAREAGLKGILFDPEPYVDPYAQFDYLRQAGREQRSFEDYVAQARLRGQQFMLAVQSEYPDITILSLFLQSYQLAKRFRGPSAYGLDSPNLAYATGSYALLPAFLDGWLDVIAPTVTLVDGHEESYYNVGPGDFALQRHQMRSEGIELVSPANRGRYAAQVQTGFAVYMDAYEASHPLALDLPAGMTYPQLYESSLSSALRMAEGYVWLYGETGTFFTRGTAPSWEVRLPWIVPATQNMRDPLNWPGVAPGLAAAAAEVRTRNNRLESWAHERALAEQKVGSAAANNLVQNGSFATGLTSWGLYNDPALGSDGSYSWLPTEGAAGPGCVSVIAATAGSVFQTIDVQPGTTLWFQARFRRIGRSEPSVSFGWRMADNSFLRNERTQLFAEEYVAYDPSASAQAAALSGRNNKDWRTIQGAVPTPAGADRLVLTLNAFDQASAADEVQFDDVLLLRVGQPGEAPMDVAAGGVSVLSNSGFEDGLTGWPSVGTASGDAAIIAADAFRGGQALKLGRGMGSVSREIAVSPGQTFVLSAWAKRIGRGVGGELGVRFLDSTGAVLVEGSKRVAVSDPHYRACRLAGVVRTGAATLSVQFGKTQVGGALLLDDVGLVIGG